MNNLTIAGTIGRDAEIRTTQNGDKVAGFSVAVSNGKDKNGEWRESTWFDCSLWGKRADSLGPHIRKGGKVAISGRVSARAHDGKAYLQVMVNEIDLLGGGEKRDDKPAGGAPAGGMVLDDEVPFAAYPWCLA